MTSFAVTPERQRARELEPHRLWLALGEGLRREHVLDLRGPDPERERTDRAVRGRVAVAAHDGHARLRHAELGPDHVHDPLAPAPGGVEGDAELLAVAPQRLELRSGQVVRRPVVRGDVVIHRGER